MPAPTATPTRPKKTLRWSTRNEDAPALARWRDGRRDQFALHPAALCPPLLPSARPVQQCKRGDMLRP
eukprot:11345800-Prorocentrum_lima.AAC.1